MHGLDMELHVRYLIPGGADVFDEVTGGECHSSAVVDIHPVWRRRGDFAPAESGGRPSDDRPYVCVGVGFADEIARIEFRVSGVDVGEVE
jgi:hypothetical protein